MIQLPKHIDLVLNYYLAGPMTGYPNYNKEAFDYALDKLAEAGIKIRSPHLIPWPVKQLQSDEEIWQYFMRGAIELELICDGIILLKGWPSSRGAVLEANIAASLKMPMYFLDGEYLVAMHGTH